MSGLYYAYSPFVLLPASRPFHVQQEPDQPHAHQPDAQPCLRVHSKHPNLSSSATYSSMSLIALTAQLLPAIQAVLECGHPLL